jgi:hypothetical protein
VGRESRHDMTEPPMKTLTLDEMLKAIPALIADLEKLHQALVRKKAASFARQACK